VRALRCVLARLTSQVSRPTFGVPDPHVFLRDLYANASSNHIGLDVDTSLLDQPLGDGEAEHYSLDLHHAVRRLLANPIDAPTVDRVAVLYGGRYINFPTIFGIMFDRGFIPDTQDDLVTDPEIVGRPREGCAIFLNAIAQDRPVPNDFDRQVQFSTVHEMGHLFNLLHIETPHNFLSTSSADNTYEPTAFHFAQEHCEQLSKADEDRHFWPGGSDFADLGSDYASQDRPSTGRTALATSLSLPKLRLSTVRDRFRYFEPVELELSISLPITAQGSTRVPDALDPGYEMFRVWIEEPNGERRLYRSPRKYCAQRLHRRLTPGDRFSRDISIFGQSGGYTFRRNGIHRLWAEFRLGPRRTIRSNALEIDIEPARKSKVPLDVARSLTQIEPAELLYHRLDRRGGRGAQVLENIVETYPRLRAAPCIRYALAKAYLADADSGDQRVARAQTHLERAIDSPMLGEHQRIKAAACLRDSKERSR
jgi:hypothetical protein